jgi:hypothetical protein
MPQRQVVRLKGRTRFNEPKQKTARKPDEFNHSNFNDAFNNDKGKFPGSTLRFQRRDLVSQDLPEFHAKT